MCCYGRIGVEELRCWFLQPHCGIFSSEPVTISYRLLQMWYCFLLWFCFYGRKLLIFLIGISFLHNHFVFSSRFFVQAYISNKSCLREKISAYRCYVKCSKNDSWCLWNNYETLRDRIRKRFYHELIFTHCRCKKQITIYHVCDFSFDLNWQCRWIKSFYYTCYAERIFLDLLLCLYFLLLKLFYFYVIDRFLLCLIWRFQRKLLQSFLMYCKFG